MPRKPVPRSPEPWNAVMADLCQPEQLDYLRQVLAVPSEGGEERELARFVARSMKSMGIETVCQESLPGRPSVIGRLRGTGRGHSLLLLAHLDVPIMADGWTIDPLGGKIRNGRIYGSGVRDMKGGLAAMILAMRAIRDARVPLEGDVVFAAVPAHMEQGVGAKALFDSGVRADMVLVGEPTGLDLLGTHLGWVVLELTVRGRGTATVTAHEGVNAVEKMAGVVQSVSRMRFRPVAVTRYVRGLMPATPCYASVAGIQGGHRFYPNFVPGTCAVTMDVRFVPGKRPTEILREVRTRLAALRRRDPALRVTVHLKYGFALEPVVSRPADPLFRVTREALRSVRGAEPTVAGFLYTTDGGVFQHGGGSSTVVCGPGSAPLRAPDEWLATREYFQATAVYVRAALEICTRTRKELAAAYPTGKRLRPT